MHHRYEEWPYTRRHFKKNIKTHKFANFVLLLLICITLLAKMVHKSYNFYHYQSLNPQQHIRILGNNKPPKITEQVRQLFLSEQRRHKQMHLIISHLTQPPIALELQRSPEHQ